MGSFVLVLLALLFAGALPVWPHSQEWGYRPFAGLGLALAVVLVLVLTGNLRL